VSKAAKRERQRVNREAARAAQEQAIKRARLVRTLRTVAVIVVLVVGVAVVVSLLRGDEDSNGGGGTADREQTVDKPTFEQPPPQTIDPTKQYTATIETSEGTIVASLEPTAAPVAVNNFVFLAREGYYDDLCIDRASKDFVIQGGSPTCDQQGDPGYSVVGEVPTDNYPLGSLAAAKGADEPAGTMGSQFFIVTGQGGSTLPNDYARFGTVTEGLDVAQRIESYAPPAGDGPPTKDVTIRKITIAETAPTPPAG
jgi:cyclophilin family peptidyl-prolyl cis-trans isomerase